MIVKHRKGQTFKNFGNNRKFQQNLAKIQDIKIFKNTFIILLYPVTLFQALNSWAHKDQ